MWIARRTLSYNLAVSIKAATALIMVSSPAITVPQMLCFRLLCSQSKTEIILQFDVRIIEFVVIEYLSFILNK